jgi:hypothetical protein
VRDHTYQVNDRVIMRCPVIPTDARQGARGTVTSEDHGAVIVAWDAPAGVHALVFADQIAPAGDLSTPRDPDAPLDALTESAIVLALDTILTAPPHGIAGVQALRDLLRGDRARQQAIPAPRPDVDTAPIEDPEPSVGPYRRGVPVVMRFPKEADDAAVDMRGTVAQVVLAGSPPYKLGRAYLLVDWYDDDDACDLVWPDQVDVCS